MNMTHDFHTPARQRLAQAAWDRILATYVNELASGPDAGSDPTNEAMSDYADRVDQARDWMIRNPAPNIAAVMAKLDAIWFDARDAQPWEQAMILNDLRRLDDAPVVMAPPESPSAERRVTRHDCARALGEHKLNNVSLPESPTDLRNALLSGVHAWLSVLEDAYADQAADNARGIDTQFEHLSAHVKAEAMHSLGLQIQLADYFIGDD
jgi:hypothetical protein